MKEIKKLEKEIRHKVNIILELNKTEDIERAMLNPINREYIGQEKRKKK